MKFIPFVKPWNDEERASSIVATYSSNQWHATVDVWGTKGLLTIDLETMNLNVHKRTSLNKSEVAYSAFASASGLVKDVFSTGINSIFGSYKNTHDHLIEGFADSIINETPSPVPAEDGKEAVRVMIEIAKGIVK